MVITKEVASACTPLIHHGEALNALNFLLQEQVSIVNQNLHNAKSWDDVLRLQGKYQILKELMTLKQDVTAVMKGT